MDNEFETRGFSDTEPYISVVTKERLDQATDEWREEGQLVVEEFTPERLQKYREKAGRRFTVVSPENPIHDHPDSEFLEIYPGAKARIQFLDTDGDVRTVTYINRTKESSVVEIVARAVHVVVLLGGFLRIYTTQRNKDGSCYPSFAEYKEQNPLNYRFVGF
jgi:hypothetical protein